MFVSRDLKLLNVDGSTVLCSEDPKKAFKYRQLRKKPLMHAKNYRVAHTVL